MKNIMLFFLAPILLGASRGQNTIPPCYKADIVFVIDYSDSMSEYINTYEPWLRATAGELPLSSHLKAGLLFFSNDVCAAQCPLTDDKLLFDEKIMQDRDCQSLGTFIEPAFIRAEEMFDQSEKERGEAVPRIIVVVTDSIVHDYVEACEFIHSEMADVFFIVIDLKHKKECAQAEMMIDCMLHNGITFDGFIWIYEDLLKQFEPCM